MKSLRKSKVLMLLLAFVLAVGTILPTVPVHAQDNLIGITLDKENFTLIGNMTDTYDVKVYGLTSSYEKVDLENPEQVTWTYEVTEGFRPIAFLEQGMLKNKVNGDLARIRFNLMEGAAVVKAQYGDFTVTSNAFLEPLIPREPAKNVTLVVNFNDESGRSFSQGGLEVGPMDLSQEGIDKCLSKRPTALNTLIQGIEKHNEQMQGDAQAYTFDIEAETGFVQSIDGKEGGSYDGVYKGWEYTVSYDGQETPPPAFGPGVYKIQDNATVTYNYVTYQW